MAAFSGGVVMKRNVQEYQLHSKRTRADLSNFELRALFQFLYLKLNGKNQKRFQLKPLEVSRIFFYCSSRVSAGKQVDLQVSHVFFFHVWVGTSKSASFLVKQQVPYPFFK